MAHRFSLGVLIVAAGQSSRLGRSKAQLKVHGRTLLEWQVAKARRLNPAWIGVVLADPSNALSRRWVKPIPSRIAVKVCVNRRARLGMGSSIACGVSAVPKRITSVLLLTVDQWAVGVRDLKRLSSGVGLRAARYANILGIPAVFPRRYFNMLCALSGEQGARAALVNATGVSIPHAAMDLDTPEDWAALRQQRHRARIAFSA